VDRRTRNLFALLFAGIVAVTGGAAILLSETSDPDAPPGTTAVVGVIVAVDSQGLGDVRGFTLRETGGKLQDFDLRDYESGSEFPPGHLAEHQATASPVRVWYREEGGVRLAIRLEDAPR
jgi:hypothetical protein